MKFLFGCMLFFLFVESSFSQEVQQIRKSEHAFNFTTNELISLDVNLEYTPDGAPAFYSSHLETDVCSDGLCKPINITVNWDLLGRFLTYHTEDKYSLTKFDHIELTKEDHNQLHSILSDTSSLIRDYEVEDMIDTTVQLRSLEVVDAVTGATNKTFEGVAVEGALYTVYTLWHFINGPIRKEILKHTEGLLSDTFVWYMLKSNNRDYVEFIFENITQSQRVRFRNEIIHLISNDDAYIPHFALANLNDTILANPALQYELLSYFPTVNTSVKNALLERFKSLKVDAKGLDILISIIPNLREDQSAKAFSIIENNKSQLHKKLIKRIKALSVSMDSSIKKHAKNILIKLD